MILEARLHVGILQAQQDRVDGQLVELGRQELVSLLGIPCCAVGGIQGLDLSLEGILTLATGTHTQSGRGLSCSHGGFCCVRPPETAAARRCHDAGPGAARDGRALARRDKISHESRDGRHPLRLSSFDSPARLSSSPACSPRPSVLFFCFQPLVLPQRRTYRAAAASVDESVIGVLVWRNLNPGKVFKFVLDRNGIPGSGHLARLPDFFRTWRELNGRTTSNPGQGRNSFGCGLAGRRPRAILEYSGRAAESR